MGSRVAAADHEKSFFDGVDISVAGIATLAQLAERDTRISRRRGLAAAIARDAADAQRQYTPDHPAAIAPALASGLKATRALVARTEASGLAEPGKSDVAFELGVKERQFQRALAAALQVSLQTSVGTGGGGRAGRGGGRGAAAAPATTAEAAPPPPPAPPNGGAQPAPVFTTAIPGQAFNVEGRIFNENAEPLAVDRLEVLASDGKNWSIRETDATPVREVAPGKEGQWRFSVTVPADATLTRPYFSRPDEEQPYYDILDARYRNLPRAPYPLALRATTHLQRSAIRNRTDSPDRRTDIGNRRGIESPHGRAGDFRYRLAVGVALYR